MSGLSGARTTGGVTWGGVYGVRSHGSGSKLDGTTFVAPTTAESRLLHKAFKGQGKTHTVLTNLPNGSQVARHGQTGLFNLSSFRKVKGQPEKAGDPPPQQKMPPSKESVGLLDPVQIQEQLGDEPPPPPSLDDLDVQITERRQTPRGHTDQDLRRDIFERDRISRELCARSTALHQRECDVRKQLDGDDLTETPPQLRQQRERVMLMAVRLELPLTLDPQGEQMQVLARRLVELEDKLRAANIPLELDKLLGILANHGRITEFAQSVLPTDQIEAVDGLTDLVETILQAVAPGRDGVELNSLFGLNVELDGLLKEVRFGALCEVLLADLAHDRDLDLNPITDDEREKIRTDARELVTLDFEIAQCQRQIGRALGMRGLGDVTHDDLVGKVGDSGLMKGLREKFGKEAEHINVVLLALKEVTQLARDCDAAKRLRGALQRELEHKQTQHGPLRQQYAQQRQELRQLSDDIARCRQRMLDAQRQGDDNACQNLENLMAVLLDRERVREDVIAPLTSLERDMARLHDRIEALTPESEMVRRELDKARGVEDELRQRKGAVEARLREVIALVSQAPMGSAQRIYREQRQRALEEGLGEVTKHYGYAQKALEYWESRQAILDDGVRGDQLRHLIDGLTGEIEDHRERLAEIEDERDGQNRLTDALENEKQARERDIGVKEQAIHEAQKEFVELLDSSPQLGGVPGEILKTARTLARQGIANSGEVSRLCGDINGLVRSLTEAGVRASQGIENELNVLNAGNNEEVARRLTGDLLGSLLGEAVDDLSAGELNDRMREKLLGGKQEGNEEYLVDETGKLSGLMEILEQNPADSRLRRLGQHYGRYETSLLNRAKGFEGLIEQRGAALKTVSDFTGRTIDRKRPEGLQLSYALIGLAQLRRQCGDRWGNALTDDEQARFDRLAERLRGFDPQRLTVPPSFVQFLHETPSLQDIDDWLDQPGLLETARAIRTLRETAEAQRDFDHDVAFCVGKLDRLVEQRQEIMGTAGEVLRDTIRAAILQQLVTTHSKVDAFRPSDHAEAIKQTLKDWGVPVDHVQPEINRMLSESFGPNELNLWRETTTLSRDYRQSLRIQKSREVSELVESSESQPLDPETTKVLLESIDNLQPGGKVKLFVGTRGEVSTGRLNTLVPGLRFNVRGGLGGVSGIEIARSSSDGYEIIIRQGFELRGGGDVTIGANLEGGMWDAARLEGVGSVDAAWQRVTGITLRFSNDANGCEALKETLTNLLTRGEITPQDLSKVDNLLPLVENKVSGRVGVTAQARFLGSSLSPDLTPWAPSGQARLGAGLGGAGKWYGAQNTRLTVDKSDKEVMIDAGFGLSFYASTTTGHPISHPISGSNIDPNLIGVDVQKGINWFFRTKTKQTRGPDGLVTAATERQYQRTLPVGWGGMTAKDRLQHLKALGGESFERMHARLSEVDKVAVEKMLLSAGAGDMINVGFALDERVRLAVNDMLLRAKAIRSGRIESKSFDEAETQAKRLEERAQRLLDDPDNYNPSKVQVIPTRENQQALALNLLGFFKLEKYVDDKSEWVALEMKFDARVGREIRDELTSPGRTSHGAEDGV